MNTKDDDTVGKWCETKSCPEREKSPEEGARYTIIGFLEFHSQQHRRGSRLYSNKGRHNTTRLPIRARHFPTITIHSCLQTRTSQPAVGASKQTHRTQADTWGRECNVQVLVTSPIGFPERHCIQRSRLERKRYLYSGHKWHILRKTSCSLKIAVSTVYIPQFSLETSVRVIPLTFAPSRSRSRLYKEDESQFPKKKTIVEDHEESLEA
ncbi:hypothetical protein KM043_012787 [Ampulex compressa]|nr:hypothetical protein KM043_012787 [Ampulex compressa]